ncbi:MAG: hypothetical protein CM15mP9_5130 [Methanobacteriota archaeon]|nr:MAG: hypothetical protein CM15mP9_5130 [Euryarchaeota archaeon]
MPGGNRYLLAALLCKAISIDILEIRGVVMREIPNPNPLYFSICSWGSKVLKNEHNGIESFPTVRRPLTNAALASSQVYPNPRHVL